MVKATLLTLMVAAGSLHATPAHFCSIMDETVETCCCEHRTQVPQAGECGTAVTEACCEAVVEWSVGDAQGLALPPAARAAGFVHDPPPVAIELPGQTPFAQAPRTPHYSARLGVAVARAGTDTYLRTLRLRL